MKGDGKYFMTKIIHTQYIIFRAKLETVTAQRRKNHPPNIQLIIVIIWHISFWSLLYMPFFYIVVMLI